MFEDLGASVDDRAKVVFPETETGYAHVQIWIRVDDDVEDDAACEE
jgi:hypothetical protein